MNDNSHRRWLHRLAWLNALAAIVAISAGSVVTTVDAGMAFPDWLTSDGVFVPLYPWLKATGDKFVEHGHRLAVIVMSVVSLVLAVAVYRKEPRSDIRLVTGLIVLGIIGQAVLGGQRVLQDDRLLALLHGDFAACVFSMMGLLVAMTGQHWPEAPSIIDPSRGTAVLAWSVVTLVVLAAQYILGGMLRHFGAAHAWLVHPWFAIVVTVASFSFYVVACRTGAKDLQRAAGWVLSLIVAQAVLGIVTWGVRYGFPQFDIVAVQQSPFQIAIRSLHKVLGLVTFMATVVAVVQTARVTAFPRIALATAGRTA